MPSSVRHRLAMETRSMARCCASSVCEVQLRHRCAELGGKRWRGVGNATMARRGESVSVTGLLLVMAMAMAMWRDGGGGAVAAQQLRLIHKYMHLDGSSAESRSQGMTPGYFQRLRVHDRRRLAAVIDFPLSGSLWTSGLYYTQISLGTPARPYAVVVDTGSYVTWLDCAPCPSCPRRSDIPGVTLSQYDPTQSSTKTVLPCHSPDCQIASFGNAPICTDPLSPQACPFEVTYGNGQWVSGYFVNDVMTFNMVANSTALPTTANVYFGCGHNLSANTGVDGIMGFAQAAISVPNQLANQKMTGAMFAHCLQGADSGGGNIVMGNITEPDIVYTAILPNHTLYNVGLQNIAVNGSNITTAASFATGPEVTRGCIIDSGTTTAVLTNPVHERFVAGVRQQVPVPLQSIPIDNSNETIPDCFIYNGSVVGTFPDVQLFFDGGAVMNLGPSNYLRQIELVDGETAYCIAWTPSNDYYTIFGDIVLKDQLVVYDLDKQRVGWKPFDCTKPIAVDNGTDATTTGGPAAEAPATPPEVGTHSGAYDGRRRRSIYVVAAWVAFAGLQTGLV